MSSNYSFLRKIPLFADLTDEDLELLCQQVEELQVPHGEILFTEGSIGQNAYVIKEGQIDIYKTANEKKVQLAVRGPGEVIGEMALLASAPRSATGQALQDSLLIIINQAQLNDLLDQSPSASRTMLTTITNRLRNTEMMLRQSEKMAQLGTLMAGIAHELNNPSAAVGRSSQQLAAAIENLQALSTALPAVMPADQVQSLDLKIRQQARQPDPLDSLTRSDREAAFEEWLEDHGLENGWELAPQLVSLVDSPQALDRLTAGFPPDRLPGLLGWMSASFTVYSLLEEVNQGAVRISEIVKALKSYVYLDQAPIQEIDVHEGLENTLVILRYKLKQGVEVVRDYDPQLPHIQAYGSELNQVWTNIIDNAIDAMEGKGRILLRTRYQDPWVVVSIEDSGPGIPPDVQARMFDPFFTTKPLGKGTGLGLNITYNIVQKHKGDIKVISQPGQTRFEVRLPVNFEKMKADTQSELIRNRPDDDSLRKILANTHTIAVVGISDKTGLPSHSVPAYLQNHGYRILPVNPRLTQVLGEPAYPDLGDLPEPVDLVLIFRSSEFAAQIVNQAIQIGAKTVWMQEDIVNESAARKAIQAGLAVVMDTCIRKSHQRLSRQAV